MTEKDEINQRYQINSEGVSARVQISQEAKEYVPVYKVSYPKIEQATRAVLDAIREEI